MRREFLIGSVLIGCALQAGKLGAQSAVQSQGPVTAVANGVHLNSLSASVMYSTGDLFGQFSGLSNTGTDKYLVGVAGGADMGWTHHTSRSDATVSYAASFVGYPQYSSASTTNHSLFFNWRRKLGGRWMFNTSVGSTLTSLDQALLSPTALSRITSVPSTFDDLASAMVNGRYTNVELASILTGASLPVSPTTIGFYGTRVFSSVAQAGLSYSISPRLNFHVNAMGSRSQNIQDKSAQPQYEYLTQHVTSGGVSTGISYSLSSRTSITAEATSSRTFSSLQDAYYTTGDLGIAHIVGRGWFVQAHGGGGFIKSVRDTYLLPTGPQYQASGGIGYKRRSHTFLATYERRMGDQFGLGAASSWSVNGVWTWRSIGRNWSTSVSGGQQRVEGVLYDQIQSWQVTGEIVRALGSHFAVSAQYAYLNYGNPYFIGTTDPTQTSVRVSIIWRPRSTRR